MFKNISIKLRLILLLSLLGLELASGAAVALIDLARANEDMRSLYTDSMVSMGQLDQIVRKLDLNQSRLFEALAARPERLPELLRGIGHDTAAIDGQWRAYSSTRLTPDEQAGAQQFLRTRARFDGEAMAPALAALQAGDMQQAAALVHGPARELFPPLRGAIDELIRIQLEEAEKAQQEAQARYERGRLQYLAAVSFGLLLAAAAGARLILGIARPLEEAVRVAAAVAAGDLTRDIALKSQDETGRLMCALEHMNAGLAAIVQRVRAGTDTIATASGQIAAGNMDLSVRTEQQAAALEETASAMEQLSAIVRQNSDSARQANALAMSASTVAEQGGAVMHQVVETMHGIHRSADRMAGIISVIDGIAFQTNILALNAAVEAARAGEEGRGFAVVAGEVRNLAQRSASAAREIKALIDESLRKADSGSALVDQAGTTMQEIVASVGRVRNIMSEIMAASAEQSSGIVQASDAIAQIDHATQQNAALVEEASAAAKVLHAEADSLAALVATFKLRAPGAAPPPAVAPALDRARRAPGTALAPW